MPRQDDVHDANSYYHEHHTGAHHEYYLTSHDVHDCNCRYRRHYAPSYHKRCRTNIEHHAVGHNTSPQHNVSCLGIVYEHACNNTLSGWSGS